MPSRILALAGSTRRGSFNRMALEVAARGAASAGAQVTRLDLADYPLPIYNGDLEASDGIPENARKLKAVFAEHQGLLIASPEYNSSLTPLLVNTIAWTSRPAPGDSPLLAYKGKAAALLAASPGALGGLRGLVHLRAILGNIGVLVLPDQVAVSKANEAFDAQGNLKEARVAESLSKLGAALAQLASRLA